VGYDVLTVARVNIFLWVAAPCRLAGGYQSFRETRCPLLQGWSPRFLPVSLRGIAMQNIIIVPMFVFLSSLFLSYCFLIPRGHFSPCLRLTCLLHTARLTSPGCLGWDGGRSPLLAIIRISWS
jgi:hypothetical protein